MDAVYLEIYLIIVLPKPKLKSDKYDTAELAKEYNPYSAWPSIRNITGVQKKGIKELNAKLTYDKITPALN